MSGCSPCSSPHGAASKGPLRDAFLLALLVCAAAERTQAFSVAAPPSRRVELVLTSARKSRGWGRSERADRSRRLVASPLVVFASGGGGDDTDRSIACTEEAGVPTEEGGSNGVGDGDVDAGIVKRINSFLDTPILDANDRSDQGPIAENLKAFVRRDPQVASVTFSAVVVLAFVGMFRLYNYVTYGI